MDHEELLKRILQIEEQARDGIAEFPNLTLERLKMIQSLARYARSQLTLRSGASALADEGARGSSDDSSPTLN